MAAIFKITFALLALCAVAYAVPSEVVNAEQTKEGIRLVLPKPVEALAAAENKADEQHAPVVSSTTEGAHSRHKRGCKSVSYTKGGRTITVQKC